MTKKKRREEKKRFSRRRCASSLEDGNFAIEQCFEYLFVVFLFRRRCRVIEGVIVTQKCSHPSVNIVTTKSIVFHTKEVSSHHDVEINEKKMSRYRNNNK